MELRAAPCGNQGFTGFLVLTSAGDFSHKEVSASTSCHILGDCSSPTPCQYPLVADGSQSTESRHAAHGFDDVMLTGHRLCLLSSSNSLSLLPWSLNPSSPHTSHHNKTLLCMCMVQIEVMDDVLPCQHLAALNHNCPKSLNCYVTSRNYRGK